MRYSVQRDGGGGGYTRCLAWTFLTGLLGRRKLWGSELHDTPDPLPEKELPSLPADVWGGAREGGGRRWDK